MRQNALIPKVNHRNFANMAKGVIRRFENQIKLEKSLRRYSWGPRAYRFLTSSPYQQTGAINDHPFLFVHVPKTGGSSLRNAFMGTSIGSHRTLAAFALHDSNRYRNSIRMGVLRDPRSRFVSAFDYLKSGGRNHQDRAFARRYFTDLASPENVLDRMETTPAFRRTILGWRHFCPQTKFVTLDGQNLDLTHPIRFETLGTDRDRIEPVIAAIGLSLSGWEFQNPTHHPESIPTDLAGRIADIYAPDCKLYEETFLSA